MAGADLGAPGGGKKKGPGGLKRMKRRVAIRIDMTPMVDVAFLLLIFFMVTTVFRKPQAMEVNLPPSDAPIEIAEINVLTLRVLDDNNIFWNVGKQPFEKVTLKELGRVLLNENKANSKLVTLIKIDRAAKYNTMVNVMDELQLNDVTRFSLSTLSDAEKAEVEVIS
jgi:biopolymer transport protein ExbD